MDKDTQLIISNLGFDANEFPDADIGKVIEIQNDKYQLLNEQDYNMHKKLFVKLMGNFS